MTSVDLNVLFMGLQAHLSAKLNTTRAVVRHAGAKGDATEAHWIEMLSAFLPERYKVTKGFVVDSKGQCSDQIDLIIHDRQYSPFLLPFDGAIHVPAESVYAVLEVKQEISKANLAYAGDKAASVRRLHRTSIGIPHAGGLYPPKPPCHILAGFLALESAWSPALGAAFMKQWTSMDGDTAVDLGCVLDHGAFARTLDGSTHLSQAEASLVWFFVTLVSHLQALGTVPALDLGAYLRSIEATTSGGPS